MGENSARNHCFTEIGRLRYIGVKAKGLGDADDMGLHSGGRVEVGEYEKERGAWGVLREVGQLNVHTVGF